MADGKPLGWGFADSQALLEPPTDELSELRSYAPKRKQPILLASQQEAIDADAQKFGESELDELRSYSPLGAKVKAHTRQAASTAAQVLTGGFVTQPFGKLPAILGTQASRGIVGGMNALGLTDKTAADVSSAEEAPLYRAANAIEGGVRDVLPPQRGYEESVPAQIIGGLASLPPALAFGVAGGGAGLFASSAIQNGVAAYEEAGIEGASEGDRDRAFWVNAIAGGALDAIPAERLISGFKRIKAAGGKDWAKLARESTIQSGVESGTEFLQQGIADLNARYSYDPDRGWEEIGERALHSGAIGGAVGLISGAGVGAAGRIAGGQAQAPSQTHPELDELRAAAPAVQPQAAPTTDQGPPPGFPGTATPPIDHQSTTDAPPIDHRSPTAPRINLTGTDPRSIQEQEAALLRQLEEGTLDPQIVAAELGQLNRGALEQRREASEQDYRSEVYGRAADERAATPHGDAEALLTELRQKVPNPPSEQEIAAEVARMEAEGLSPAQAFEQILARGRAFTASQSPAAAPLQSEPISGNAVQTPFAPTGEGGAAAASPEAGIGGTLAPSKPLVSQGPQEAARATQEEDAYFAKFQADTGVAVKRVQPKGDPEATYVEERLGQYGTRVVWFDPEGGRVPAGAHMKQGLVFLDATKPAQARRYVAHHEVFHELTKRHPDIAQRLTDVMRRADPEAFAQRGQKYLKSFEGSPIQIRPEMIEEESAAVTVEDFGGFMDAALRTPESLQAALEKHPGLWKSIADALLKVLRRIGVYKGKTFAHRARLKALSEFAETPYERGGIKPNVAAQLALEIKQAFDLLTEEEAAPSEAAKAQQPGEFAEPARYAPPREEKPWQVSVKGQPVEASPGSPEEAALDMVQEADSHDEYGPALKRARKEAEARLRELNAEKAEPKERAFHRKVLNTLRDWEKQGAEVSGGRELHEEPRYAAPPAVSGTGDAQGFSIPDEKRLEYFERRVLDRFNRPRVVQKSIQSQGAEITEAQDVSLAETLMSGRAAEQIRLIEAGPERQVAKLIADHDLKVEAVDDYLYARHAPDRNALMKKRHPGMTGKGPTRRPKFGLEANPGSGMTNSEAARLLQEAESGPNAAAFKRIGAIVNRVTAKNREMRVEAGMLSAEGRKKWEEDFGPHYVPLKNAPDASDPIVGTKSLAVKDKTKRAEGRRSRASSPLAHLFADTKEVVLTAEKLRVGQTLANAIRAHPDPVWEVTDQPSKSDVNKGHALGFMEQGEERSIVVRDDLFAKALKGVGVEETHKILRHARRLMRAYGQLVTTFYPNFAVSNFERDMQTAAVNLTAEQSAGFAKEVLDPRKLPGAYKALRAIAKDPDAKGDLENVAREFQEYGGKTGFVTSLGFEAQAQKLSDAIAREKGGFSLATAKGVAEWVRDVNEAVENVTRLRTYQVARSRDLSPARAAEVARNVTLNFNRQGEISPLANSLYLFFSARANGAARVAKLVATNRKAQAIAGALTAFGFAVSMANRMLGGDDDDTGKPRIDSYSSGYKASNLIFLVPGTDKDFHLPTGYGFGVFVRLGSIAEELTFGPSTPGQAAVDSMTAMFEAVSPVTGASWLQAVAPTILRPPVEVETNEDWAGRPVAPPEDPYSRTPKPDSQRHFRSVSPFWKKIAKEMNSLSGGDEITPGAVDISPETMEHYSNWVMGGAGRFVTSLATLPGKVASGDWGFSDLPFLRVNVGDKPEGAGSKAYYETLGKIEMAAKREKAEKKLSRKETRLADLASEAKAADKELRALREELDEAKSDAAKKRIEREIRAVQARLVKEASR